MVIACLVKIYDHSSGYSVRIKIDEEYIDLNFFNDTEFKKLYEEKYNNNITDFKEFVLTVLRDFNICLRQIDEKHSILEYCAFHTEQRITSDYNKHLHYISCETILKLKKYKLNQKNLFPVEFYTK